MTREEAIKYLKQWNPINPAKKEAVEMAIDLLGQPQIVRCKDCKYQKDPHCWVYFFTHKTEDDWFCADGERKEGDSK